MSDPSIIQNFNAPVATVADMVIQMPSPPAPEWEKQQKFEKAFGECSKEAREWLEYMMEQRGFTLGELRSAWRAGSLRWHRGKQIPVFITPMLEAVWIMGAFGVLTLIIVALGLAVVFSTKNFTLQHTLLVYGVGFFYLGMMYLLGRFFVRPRRVAFRARKAWEQDREARGE